MNSDIDECALNAYLGKFDSEREAKEVLLALLTKARIDELQGLPRAGFVGRDGLRFEALLHSQIDNRLAELQNSLKERET